MQLNERYALIQNQQFDCNWQSQLPAFIIIGHGQGSGQAKHCLPKAAAPQPQDEFAQVEIKYLAKNSFYKYLCNFYMYRARYINVKYLYIHTYIF